MFLEALQAGLISRISKEDEEPRIEALKVAEEIIQYSRSVTAIGKHFFYTQIELPQRDAYRFVFTFPIVFFLLQNLSFLMDSSRLLSFHFVLSFLFPFFGFLKLCHRDSGVGVNELESTPNE